MIPGLDRLLSAVLGGGFARRPLSPVEKARIRIRRWIVVCAAIGLPAARSPSGPHRPRRAIDDRGLLLARTLLPPLVTTSDRVTRIQRFDSRARQQPFRRPRPYQHALWS